MTVKKIKAHGLSADLVDPDWPALTLSEVDLVLLRYPAAGCAREILSYSPRPFAAASVVATARENVFVKRHHISVRDPAGLLEEHRFIAYLRSRGAAVPEVLQNEDGNSFTARDDWTYEVHAIAQGLDLYRDAMSWTPFLNPDHARAAGRALSALHLAAQGYNAPRRKVQPLVSSFTIFASTDPRKELVRYVEQRPALAQYLNQRKWQGEMFDLLMPFYETLQPFIADLKPLWAHNDLHASNMLWGEEEGAAEVTSIIDFGLADKTSALYDLATAIERNAIEWLRLPDTSSQLVHLEHIEALLNGYESLAPLSCRQYEALSALLPLAHIEFALSEIEYFCGITRSAANADIAYETFLLGHAEWFRDAEGVALLEFLRQRADDTAPRESKPLGRSS